MRHPRYNKEKRTMVRSFWSWVKEIVILSLIAFILVVFFIQIGRVHGQAMKPNYDDGDVVFVEKFSYRILSPKRGDVVLMSLGQDTEKRSVIRRIIAVPGDRLCIVEGKVQINGKTGDYPFADGYIEEGGSAQEEITLDKDTYFVMGDNCNNCEDSRHESIGLIKKKQLIGRILFGR